MRLPEGELVVLDIAGAKARLACDKPATESMLIGIGFAREGDQLVRKIADDSDRQSLVRELMSMGAVFAGGRDWSPSELVDFYREQGHVTGRYRSITWQGPDRYSISTR